MSIKRVNKGEIVERQVLNALGYYQTSYKAHYDGFAGNRTVQVKAVIDGNYPSISYKYAKSNTEKSNIDMLDKFIENLDILILAKAHTETSGEVIVDEYKMIEGEAIGEKLRPIVKPMYQGKKGKNPLPQLRIMLNKKNWASL